ncbi:MAG: imidazole glycerol phosphate synthase subunit HisH [Archaeoglobaceae archaeon]|nr:imidazole glycerol phosphate synthase subunit HisH [Archaeoglobaceae archaeon]MDW7989246.1 imidazole glycerol phosphate synthase subunit HisH [Archaeoglobaceae archaeon]
MIVIVNYGVGNLKSVLKGIEAVKGVAKVTCDVEEIKKASGIVFPGVGAFETAIEKLKSIKDEIPDVPKLGICLGMQLFATRSYENGIHEGLNYIPGEVIRFPSVVGKVPHMGWNEIKMRRYSELFDGIEDGSMLYFVHSYYLKTEERFLIAETDYGITFASAVESKNCYGVQFHPEKSGKTGLRVLENFLKITKT